MLPGCLQAGLHPARIAEMPILRRLQRLGEEFGEQDTRKLLLLRHEIDFAFDTLVPDVAHAR